MPQDKGDLLKQAPQSPERPPDGERAPEATRKVPVREVAQKPEGPLEIPIKAFPTPPSPPPVPPSPKEPVLVSIEAILAEDLDEVYAGLPAEVRPKFKAKGEEVARTIRAMIAEAKVKARKVLKLIVGWLKIIPGVSKFFLEQEAAIKTQKIVTLAGEQKKKG